MPTGTLDIKFADGIIKSSGTATGEGVKYVAAADTGRVMQLEEALSKAQADSQKRKEALEINERQMRELQSEIARKDAEITREVSARDAKIRTLEEAVEQMRQAETTGELVRIVAERREKQNEELKAEIVSLKKQLEEVQRLSKADADAVQITCMNLQDQNAKMEQELRILKRRVGTSYTSEELANSFNETINSFNSRMNASDQSVNYIINSMDVDLKAQIVKDESGQVRFLTEVNSEGENAMSTLKITVRAVPK
ncbi:MAG: hypothetical protein J5795_05390 [Lachnospiraceae bacterium]|nr:hypothetical protein [Lachnospiraceae bacterium]MBO4767498.1 hypothetical protein [Lachnospiraceae bacterium]